MDKKKVSIIAGVGGLAIVGAVAFLRKRAKHQNNWHRQQRKVDMTSEDSFPASDPPSWTPVQSPGSGA